MKIAAQFCVNEYGTNSLCGCLNDMESWHNILSAAGYQVSQYADANATGRRYKEKLAEMVQRCNEFGPGARMIMQNSSHGTQVRDRNGDEADGYDEALYLRGTFPIVTDDEVFKIMYNLRKDCTATIICDSCYSGTMLRGRSRHGATATPARYHPCRLSLSRRWGKENVRMFKTTAMLANVTLLAACSEGETAADAYIAGKWQGAFTAKAVPLLAANPFMTYAEFSKAIALLLPNTRYEQTPQVMFNDEMTNERIL